MIETLALVIIICKIKGYKIRPIFNTWHIYPVIIMELMILFVQFNIFIDNHWVVQYAAFVKGMYISSYIFVIFKYDLYIKAIIGAFFVTLGGILNDIAIKANDGFMPVFPYLSYLTGYVAPEDFGTVDNLHILGSSNTNLIFLTDIFDLGYCVLSIGDVFIRLFVFIIVFSSIKKENTIDKAIKENNIC
ncbi:MAG: DUF5317 family protein [Clostridium sp.]